MHLYTIFYIIWNIETGAQDSTGRAEFLARTQEEAIRKFDKRRHFIVDGETDKFRIEITEIFID